MKYVPNKDYCTLAWEQPLGLSFEHACWIHDSLYAEQRFMRVFSDLAFFILLIGKTFEDSIEPLWELESPFAYHLMMFPVRIVGGLILSVVYFLGVLIAGRYFWELGGKDCG